MSLKATVENCGLLTTVDDQALVPVIFVFTIRQGSSSWIFRLNSENYTAYPAEQEVLIKEGCKVYVLAVNRVYSYRYSTTFTTIHILTRF